MLVAPNSSAGVVLSQPPISTTPSTGWPRNNSSASIANRLRYSMVVGFRNDSDSDSAGSSMGKPPAISTPRLTSSTRDLKCMWQGCASDQVLRIAITGRPFHSSGAYPICIARERWPKALRSSGANQRALHRISGESNSPRGLMKLSARSGAHELRLEGLFERKCLHVNENSAKSLQPDVDLIPAQGGESGVGKDPGRRR